MALCQQLNGCWLCLEIIVDFILIVWSIVLLVQIQDDFYNVLAHGADVYVANDVNYLGPVQILCIRSDNSKIKENCDQALATHSTTTPTQNYFSLRYLELLQGDNYHVTIQDIHQGRHNLFIVLSIYIVIWFCLSCAGKLQSNRDVVDTPHPAYFVSICILENQLGCFKMLMLNVFAISEDAEGILLLQYIPGFSLVIYIVSTILLACFGGAIQDIYTKYEWMKNICLWTVIILLITYFVMFILPSFGLNVYALNFCMQFTAISNGMLSSEVINHVNLLRAFAFYFGIISWIKTISPLIQMCWTRRKSKLLLDGDPNPTYT